MHGDSHRALTVGLVFVVCLVLGCGGGGGGGGGATGDLPVQGTKTYAVSGVDGAGFNHAEVTVQVQELPSGRAGSYKIRISSSDGLFQNAEVTITKLSKNRVEGTVTATNGDLYDVVIVFESARKVTITFTRRSDNASTGAKSGDEVPTGGSADATLMAAATKKLEDLITAGAHNQRVDLAMLREVRDAYAAARNSGTGDPRAAFGWSLLNIAVLAGESAERAGVDPEDIVLNGDVFGAGGGGGGGGFNGRLLLYGLQASGRLYNPGGLVEAVAAAPSAVGPGALAPLTLPRTVVEQTARSRAVYDGIDTQKVENEVRNTMIPALNEAWQALEVAAGASSFSYDIHFTDENNDAWTLTFKPEEARLASATLDLVRAGMHLALVYQGAHGDFESPTVTEAELADGSLTPAEYLFASPFGLLQSGGVENSRQALAMFQRATASLAAAWQAINAKNSIAGQNLDELVVERRALSAQRRKDITDGLAEVTKLFAGKYTINYGYIERWLQAGDTVDPDVKSTIVSVNVPAFWNNPPQDLRSVLPTFGQSVLNEFSLNDRHGQFIVGTFRDKVYGSWPSQGGLVSAGGLLDPPVQQQSLLALTEMHIFVDEVGDSPGNFDVAFEGWGPLSHDLVPWDGAKTFQLTMVDILALTDPATFGLTVVWTDLAAAARRSTSFRENQFVLTSDDGRFNNTAAQVTSVGQNWLSGVVTSTTGTAYDVWAEVQFPWPDPTDLRFSMQLQSDAELWRGYVANGTKQVSGVVMGSDTLFPIEGVTVTAGSASTTSGFQGNFSLIVPNASGVMLTFEKAGYETLVWPIQEWDGDIWVELMRVNARAEPAPVSRSGRR